jgi:hypothetical protein
MKITEFPNKLISYGFNGRSGARISVGVSDDGLTRIYFPGCIEAVIVSHGHPISIDVSGNGPGPDVAVLIEAFRERTF